MHDTRLHTPHWPGILMPVLMVLAAAIWPAAARAQSDMILTRHASMPSLYNPARAGETDWLRIAGGARLQWVGVHGAPKAFLGVADCPFALGTQRIGAGVTINQESIGLFSNLLISAQGSWNRRLGPGRLSLGLQVGYANSRFRGSDVYIPGDDDYHQPNDPSIPTQDLSGNGVDFALGASYSWKQWHAGISAMHLASPSITLRQEGTAATDAKEFVTTRRRTLYFDAGGNIELKNTLFLLQPSILAASDFKDFSAVASVCALYNRFISFGLGYRWNESVAVTVGGEFKNFFVNYTFDWPTSALGRASSGSHEIVAGYRLKLDFSGQNKHRHRSIRIM